MAFARTTETEDYSYSSHRAIIQNCLVLCYKKRLWKLILSASFWGFGRK
jgi:hypothetical protein